MMMIIFSFLLLAGCIQLGLWYRQQKRMRRLQQAEAARNRVELTRRLLRNPLGGWLSRLMDTMRLHLLGKQRATALRHVLLLLLVQAASFYVNQNYLNLSPLIIHPACFVLTLYGLYLNSKKKMRLEFDAQFSEALNIINSSIRAGNSVIQGIEQCGQKIDGVLGDEFRQISQRLEIGEDAESVFLASWRRLPFSEYYFFIITVQLNMKGGGQVKEVMSRLGTLISNARVLEKKKYAMTSEVRMSIKILTAIPIFFFFFLKFQSPANFDILLHHPTGQMMLYYAICSILLGLLIVWMMMNKI
uniref:type II secretion system F family protein n=1 Tax=Klebsiella sp. TaxID=576 RepID=UPI0031D0CDC5